MRAKNRSSTQGMNLRADLADGHGGDPHSAKESARVSVGGALYLAEARYLQHELKKHGVDGELRSDRSLGVPSDAIHTIVVDRRVLKTALSVRERILPEDGEPEVATSEPHSTDKTSLRKPLVLGFLGAITGMRIGSHLHGSVWMSFLLPVLFASVAFWAGSVWSSREAR